jgi:hypothetical protein
VRLLVALIVAATALFVVGVAIERSSGETGHHEAVAEEGEEAEAPSESRPLGVDIEAWPFVALAAAASLGLAAAAAWRRPDAPGLALLVALAMLAFAALDVREVIHQLDAEENGLAVLAGAVAALHLAAALVAGGVARGMYGGPRSRSHPSARVRESGSKSGADAQR